MNRRLELHQILVDILNSKYVYFQPPESIKMVYPCIVYGLNNINSTYANDKTYINKKQYTITFISKDPDYDVHCELLNLPLCNFDRSYVADNLYHWVYDIYY